MQRLFHNVYMTGGLDSLLISSIVFLRMVSIISLFGVSWHIVMFIKYVLCVYTLLQSLFIDHILVIINSSGFSSLAFRKCCITLQAVILLAYTL